MASSKGRTSGDQPASPACGARCSSRRAARSVAAPPRLAAITVVLLTLTGCSNGLLDSKLPDDVTDPAITKTRDGALAAYRGVVVQFRRAFGGIFPDPGRGNVSGMSFVAITGELTDELQNGRVAARELFAGGDAADRRDFSNKGSDSDARPVAGTYSALQRVRGQAGQAIGLLRDYAPDQPALVGHAYALAGYAEVFLAELFCSGIPLSTLDYNGDYTPQPGSSTTEVLTHASGLFDSALALASENARIMDLARLGKARALLDLGNYVPAAATVSSIADDYRYAAYFGVEGVADTSVALDNQHNFVLYDDFDSWSISVADREGGRGLDYVSSGDPRSSTEPMNGRNVPTKYASNGSSPIVVASGLEARLIEAEAALRGDPAGSTWLDKLNYLRQTQTFWSQIVPNPGAPLAELEDPGAALSGAAADSARVSLLFRERAFWLFLTGHRQGDLRRLLRDPQYRQYWPSQDRLYPIGPYPAGGVYAGDVTAPIPVEEQSTNPLFTGCISRGA